MDIEESPLETAAGDITTATTIAEDKTTTNPLTLVLDEQPVVSNTSTNEAVEAFNVKSICLGPAAVIDTGDDDADDFDDILKVMGWDTRAPKDPLTAVVKTISPKTGPKPVTKPRPK